MTDPATSPALGAQPDRDSVPAGDQETAAAPAVERPSGPSVGTYRDKSGRVYYASPSAPHTVKAVAAGIWAEADVEGRFDPTKALVREVLQHLRENATDRAEVDRVKAAEAAGEDRTTIREWQPGQ